MRKFLLITFILSFFSQFGQQVSIAEHLKTWNNTSLPDSVRLTAMFFASSGYLYKKPDSALYCAQIQYDYAKSKNLKKPASSAYNIIGTYYNNKQNYDTAIKYYKEAYRVRAEMGDKIFMGVALSNIGNAYYSKSDFRTALTYLNKSLELRKTIGNPVHLEDSYGRLCNVYIKLEELDKAEYYCLESLKLSEKSKNEKGSMNTLNNLGTIYLKQGNYIKAMDCALKSLSIKTKFGDSLGIASSYFNLGNLYNAEGDIGKAKNYFQKAVDIYQLREESQGLIMSLNLLGNLYTGERHFNKAMELYEKSIGHLKKFDFKPGLVLTLSDIGYKYKHEAELEIKQHRFEKAKPLLEQSLSYYRKAKDLAFTINEKRDLSNSTLQISDIYLFKSIIYKMLNNPDSSKYYFNAGIKTASEALTTANEISSPGLLRNVSKQFWWFYWFSDNLDEAKFYGNEVLNINRKILAFNFTSFTEFEKEMYFKKISPDYDAFFTLVLKQSQKGKAGSEEVYNYALKNKGLLLRSSTALRNIILNGKDSSLISEYHHWTALKKQLAENYSNGQSSADLEKKADSLEKEIVKSSSAFNDFNKLQNITWKDVKNKTGKNSASIEFVRFNKKIFDWTDTIQTYVYCALIITPNCRRPYFVELFDEQELQKILGNKIETGDSYVTNIYGDRNNVNTKLYDLIWKPMEQYLKEAKTIYYSPAGLLHKISFAAMSINKETFLCDNYRLELQGSTGRLALPEKFEFTARAATCIFGDIQYDTPETLKDTMALLSWPYLEGTKTESEKVNHILRSNLLKANYVNGNNATEAEFKLQAPQSNIVHIATHGFFFSDPDAYTYAEKNDTSKKETIAYRGGNRAIGVHNFLVNQNPLMRSGLVFAGANEVWLNEENKDKEDGVLTAQEVAALDLRKTNLVVLSACETGLGDIKGTEGVYGLQRSLKMAGVKYIIMSLWQVPDSETVEFMEKFYTKLVKTKDIKISFYETRNEMRKKYDPFYWAAFVLLE